MNAKDAFDEVLDRLIVTVRDHAVGHERDSAAVSKLANHARIAERVREKLMGLSCMTGEAPGMGDKHEVEVALSYLERLA